MCWGLGFRGFWATEYVSALNFRVKVLGVRVCWFQGFECLGFGVRRFSMLTAVRFDFELRVVSTWCEGLVIRALE